jgi:hypothetical protein
MMFPGIYLRVLQISCRGDFFGFAVIFCLEIKEFVFADYFGQGEKPLAVIAFKYPACYFFSAYIFFDNYLAVFLQRSNDGFFYL